MAKDLFSPSHTGLTTRLRPTCDRNVLESWANRRKNVRLVAEIVGDRQGKSSRDEVVVMFKTPKAPITPGARPGYDLYATEKCWNRRQIVERTYDWSQRSWVIAKTKSVVARSMVMFKTSNLRFQIVLVSRMTVRSVVGRNN